MSTATSRQGRVQSFPYNATDPTGPQRDVEEHHKEALEAIETGSPVSYSYIAIRTLATHSSVSCNVSV